MKQLRDSASEVALAPIERCFTLLEDVERYPAWHPEAVRAVEVLERDGEGRARRVRATLHVSRGPFSRDLHLEMVVTSTHPTAVTLTRQANDPSDHEEFEVRWRLAAEGNATALALEIDANLDVPRVLPLAGIGDATTSAFVAAAAAAAAGV